MGAERPILRPPYCAILLYRVAWRRCFGFNLLHLGWIDYIYLVVEPTHLKHMLVKLGNLPQIGVENEKIFETTTYRYVYFMSIYHDNDPRSPLKIRRTLTMIIDLWHLTRYTWVGFCSTNLKHMSPIGSFPQVGVNTKKWNHHPVIPFPSPLPHSVPGFNHPVPWLWVTFFRSLEFWWETFLSMASLKKSVDFWTLAFTSWDLLKTLKG